MRGGAGESGDVKRLCLASLCAPYIKILFQISLPSLLPPLLLILLWMLGGTHWPVLVPSHPVLKISPPVCVVVFGGHLALVVLNACAVQGGGVSQTAAGLHHQNSSQLEQWGQACTATTVWLLEARTGNSPFPLISA